MPKTLQCRGFISGIYTSVIGAGAGVGPVFGSFLTQLWGFPAAIAFYGFLYVAFGALTLGLIVLLSCGAAGQKYRVNTCWWWCRRRMGVAGAGWCRTGEEEAPLLLGVGGEHISSGASGTNLAYKT